MFEESFESLSKYKAADWFYDDNIEYKTPAHIIEMLINVVSLGECLLLNILQLSNGTLDDEIYWRNIDKTILEVNVPENELKMFSYPYVLKVTIK